MSQYYQKFRSHRHLSQGFTIMELMIATTVFAVVMMVIVSSFLQIGRLYYKGVSVTSTTEDTRTLVDDIANDIKFGQSQPSITPYNSGTANYFCVGSHRYAYKLGQQVTGGDVDSPNPYASPVGVIQSDIGYTCSAPDSSNGGSPRQLLGANMQLNQLQLNGSSNACSTQVCNLLVHVVYYGGDNTVFDTNLPDWKNTADNPSKASGAPDAYCSGDLISTQFCAATEFSTDILIGGI